MARERFLSSLDFLHKFGRRESIETVRVGHHGGRQAALEQQLVDDEQAHGAGVAILEKVCLLQLLAAARDGLELGVTRRRGLYSFGIAPQDLARARLDSMT